MHSVAQLVLYGGNVPFFDIYSVSVSYSCYPTQHVILLLPSTQRNENTTVVYLCTHTWLHSVMSAYRDLLRHTESCALFP